MTGAKELYPRGVADAVAALYPKPAELAELISSDAAAFKTAMSRAGITAAADGGGVEIVAALSSQYERPLTPQAVAAEFGMTAGDFNKVASARAEGENKLLLNLLSQGKAPRDRFEKAFASLAGQISDDEAVVLTVVETKPIPVVKVQPQAGLTLTLTASRLSYRRNDTADFTVVASQDCYLTLLNLDEKGKGATVIFPNKFQQNNRIPANTPVAVPGPDAPFQFRLGETGIETVIAICTEKNAPVDGIVHDFDRSAFTEIPDYTKAIARAITVEKKTPAAKAPPAPAAASRAAIKVLVR